MELVESNFPMNFRSIYWQKQLQNKLNNDWNDKQIAFWLF